MHVEDLKRWHWVVIAIGIGLALSYVWSSVEWDENLPTIGQPAFEAGLTTKAPAAGALGSVTGMPPGEGKYKVLAEQYRNSIEPGKMDIRPVAYMADTPYKAGMWRDGNGESYPTVLDYLKQAKSQDPTISYKFAWYRETWAVYTLCTGAA